MNEINPLLTINRHLGSSGNCFHLSAREWVVRPYAGAGRSRPHYGLLESLAVLRARSVRESPPMNGVRVGEVVTLILDEKFHENAGDVSNRRLLFAMKLH